jgi:hypothetical protein
MGGCTLPMCQGRPEFGSYARVADVCISGFFSTVGPLCWVAVNADSLFCNVFVQTSNLLQVPVESVSRGNDKAIRNEKSQGNSQRELSPILKQDRANQDG